MIISTLKALAVLVALKLRYGEEPGRSKERVRIAPTLTDNRGNGAALNQLMTTKFLASARLMELACYVKKMSTRAVVEWAPREGTKEADRLANGDHGAFDPALRIPVNADSLSWAFLSSGSTCIGTESGESIPGGEAVWEIAEQSNEAEEEEGRGTFEGDRSMVVSCGKVSWVAHIVLCFIIYSSQVSSLAYFYVSS